MIVLDASIWVSVVLRDDIHHNLSISWIERMTWSGQLFIVPLLFLAEVGAAVVRRSSIPEDGHRAIADVLRDPTFQIAAFDRPAATAAAHLAIDLRLRGADAVYVELAQRMGVPLATWDRELAARASPAVQILAPT